MLSPSSLMMIMRLSKPLLLLIKRIPVKIPFHFKPLLVLGLISLSCLVFSQPAQAADAYIKRYLAKEPVELKADSNRTQKTYTPDQLSQGKELFELHCLNCHVGGATLPDPTISLSIEDLKGATPPRDNLEALVAFMRDPMTYDGTSPSLWCRQVTEKWMSDEKIETLAAFILRAAQKAPGWGTDQF